MNAMTKTKAKSRAGRRKAKPVTMPETSWDQGASGAANQERLVTEARGEVDAITGKRINPNGIKGKRRTPWVETYRKQGKLSDAEYTTAIRLYAAYQGYPDKDSLAAIGEVRVAGNGGPLASLIDSRREFYAMWADVPLSSRYIVEQVVLLDNPIRSTPGGSNYELRKSQLQRLCVGLSAIS
jgi:hypothetical protein